MKLSDIVAYKNLLDEMSSQYTAKNTLLELEGIVKCVKESTVQEPALLQDLMGAHNRVEKYLTVFEQHLNRLKHQVQLKIEAAEPAYFEASAELYSGGMRNDSPEYIAKRELTTEPLSGLLLQQRLKLYTSWQYPGMVIRPIHARYVDDLVACDPMYFVDTHADLLTPTETWFTEEYQRRIRKYVVEEYSDHAIFQNLPAGQFGLVYAHNYFSFKPWPVLQSYLGEVFTLLRPGGVFVFSYNNCDLAGRVKLTENHFTCYTPGRLVKQHALAAGYEIIFEYNDEGNTSWLELRRPGQLTSIRGGQTLAGVLHKPKVLMPEETAGPGVDKEYIPLYNYNEIKLLLHVAKILDIDMSKDKSNGEYSAKKMRRTISHHMNTEGFPAQKLDRIINKGQKNERPPT